MLQTLKNAWKTQELRTKLLFTLLIVILYRLGSCIPVPFVDSAQMAGVINTSFNYAVQLVAGDAFSTATLFALSVSPYITASIIIQLLTVAIPALERLAKEGEEGKKKINAITRIVTMALAAITAFGYTTLLVSNKVVTYMQNYTYSSTKGWTYSALAGKELAGKSVDMKFFGATGSDLFYFIVIIACYCAGAALVMWLAEKINEHGIGNGISIILFANIVARIPNTILNLYSMIVSAKGVTNIIISIVWSVLIVALLLGLSYLVVWFTDSERRIPVQYAKRVVGRKMYGGQSSNLPLKLNMAGVMPVIFANSIVSIPGTLATIWPNVNWISGLANNYFNYTKPLYVLLSIILLFAFAYFYIMISFNPVEVANNIRNNGGAVPGIRPGRPTSDYIKKILNRITFIGAIFLCIVSEIPKVVVSIFETIKEIAATQVETGAVINAIVNFYKAGSTSFLTVAFAGTSVLIVVGVILETVRQLEAQLTMRNYKGFLD
ncbi:MAG: preprotein translocase subunit SecY [Clostridia bacterium]|nr:preprotein translocase subunit SecY [Clostridia bacterium]